MMLFEVSTTVWGFLRCDETSLALVFSVKRHTILIAYYGYDQLPGCVFSCVHAQGSGDINTSGFLAENKTLRPILHASTAQLLAKLLAQCSLIGWRKKH